MWKMVVKVVMVVVAKCGNASYDADWRVSTELSCGVHGIKLQLTNCGVHGPSASCKVLKSRIIFPVNLQALEQQLFCGPLSRTTHVSRYQKKHSPTHHPDYHPVFISFFHLLRSITSFLFKLRAWQSFCTTSLHVLCGLPLGLKPSTSYSLHFFTQSVSSFRNTCPYHRNLFCYSINII